MILSREVLEYLRRLLKEAILVIDGQLSKETPSSVGGKK
jgi:hypothetical protein